MTHHSIERTKQRAKLNNESAMRMIERARARGKGMEDFKSRERDYLLGKSEEEKRALVYDHYCFIFGLEGKCITMYEVPSWFGKKKNYSGKKAIRNVKKYIRCNPEYGMCF